VKKKSWKFQVKKSWKFSNEKYRENSKEIKIVKIQNKKSWKFKVKNRENSMKKQKSWNHDESPLFESKSMRFDEKMWKFKTLKKFVKMWRYCFDLLRFHEKMTKNSKYEKSWKCDGSAIIYCYLSQFHEKNDQKF